MKLRPLGAELFYVDGRTDGQTDMTRLVVAFRNFANTPKNKLRYTRQWSKQIFEKHVCFLFLQLVLGLPELPTF
jgi:hypothetical protein